MVFNLRLALGKLYPQKFGAHSLGLPILPRPCCFPGVGCREQKRIYGVGAAAVERRSGCDRCPC